MPTANGGATAAQAERAGATGAQPNITRTSSVADDVLDALKHHRVPRLAAFKNAIGALAHLLPNFQVTAIVKKQPVLSGLSSLVMDDATSAEVTSLLVRGNLRPPSDYQLECGHHYGVYISGELCAYMCVLHAVLANNPRSRAASIELLCTRPGYHLGSRMVQALRLDIEGRARHARCIIFTQAANSASRSFSRPPPPSLATLAPDRPSLMARSPGLQGSGEDNCLGINWQRSWLRSSTSSM